MTCFYTTLLFCVFAFFVHHFNIYGEAKVLNFFLQHAVIQFSITSPKLQPTTTSCYDLTDTSLLQE